MVALGYPRRHKGVRFSGAIPGAVPQVDPEVNPDVIPEVIPQVHPGPLPGQPRKSIWTLNGSRPSTQCPAFLDLPRGANQNSSATSSLARLKGRRPASCRPGQAGARAGRSPSRPRCRRSRRSLRERLRAIERTPQQAATCPPAAAGSRVPIRRTRRPVRRRRSRRSPAARSAARCRSSTRRPGPARGRRWPGSGEGQLIVGFEREARRLLPRRDVVRLHPVEAAIAGQVQAGPHQLPDLPSADVQPAFAFPVVEGAADRIGGDVAGAHSPVFETAGTEAGDQAATVRSQRVQRGSCASKRSMS